MLSSTVGSGQPGAGDGLLLDAFTAAAIGTVTFRRGEYNIAGTVLAVVLLTTLFNGMTMIGWAPYWQYIVKGVVLVAAVGASMGTSQDR
jgi:ribose transport system permease protein